MRKFILLTSVLLTAPFAVGNVSAQCVATQDCASLGYTETSCENGGIKCPFGNAWACKSENNSQGNNNQDCIIGSLYYSDGTCSYSYIFDKTPIGVVVYDENNEKWIMALEDSKSCVQWAVKHYDISKIANYDTSNDVIKDFNSCENTEAMLALGEEKYPAAAAAKNYAPAGAESTKGKWCLPSAGILNTINTHYTEISNTLRSLSRSKDFSGSYWSSSEESSGGAWYWLSNNTISDKRGFYFSQKESCLDFRAIMKI